MLFRSNGKDFSVRIMAVYVGSDAWYTTSSLQLSDNTSDAVIIQLVVLTAPSLAIPLMFTGTATTTGDITMSWMMVRTFRAP